MAFPAPATAYVSNFSRRMIPHPLTAVKPTPQPAATAAGMEQAKQQVAQEHGPQMPAAAPGMAPASPAKLASLSSRGLPQLRRKHAGSGSEAFSSRTVKKKPWSTQGEEAWESYEQWKKKASCHSLERLSPLGQNFFGPLLDHGLTVEELRQAVDKTASLDAGLHQELIQDFEKIAFPGQGLVGKAVGWGMNRLRNAPMVGNYFKNRAGQAATQSLWNQIPSAAGTAAPGWGARTFGSAAKPTLAGMAGRGALGAFAGAEGGSLADATLGGGEHPGWSTGGAVAGALSGAFGHRLPAGIGQHINRLGFQGGNIAGTVNMGRQVGQAELGNQLQQQIAKQPQYIQDMANDIRAGKQVDPMRHMLGGLGLNNIPLLNQMPGWQQMHPGLQLMTLLGGAGALGGFASGHNGMGTGGLLAAAAPFLMHHFMNQQGGGQQPASPEQAPEQPQQAPQVPPHFIGLPPQMNPLLRGSPAQSPAAPPGVNPMAQPAGEPAGAAFNPF